MLIRASVYFAERSGAKEGEDTSSTSILFLSRNIKFSFRQISIKFDNIIMARIYRDIFELEKQKQLKDVE